jgi:hypothetical protein
MVVDVVRVKAQLRSSLQGGLSSMCVSLDRCWRLCQCSVMKAPLNRKTTIFDPNAMGQ